MRIYICLAIFPFSVGRGMPHSRCGRPPVAGMMRYLATSTTADTGNRLWHGSSANDVIYSTKYVHAHGLGLTLLPPCTEIRGPCRPCCRLELVQLHEKANGGAKDITCLPAHCARISPFSLSSEITICQIADALSL